MALNRIPVWRGPRDLIETDDSPEVSDDVSSLTVTRTYAGPYATCLSEKPAINSAMAGFGSGVRIERTVVKRAAGGSATLTVIAKADRSNSGGGGGGTATQPPEIDVDWSRVDIPLGKAEIFKNLTDADWTKIKAWQACETTYGNRYGNFEYQLDKDGPWTALTGDPLKYAGKIRKGIDSKMTYIPVIRRSTPYSEPPTVNSCGQRDTPPISIAGYDFLKTADRRHKRNGRWSREEEWTGFEDLDEDIYPNS